MFRFVAVIALASLWAASAGSLLAQNQSGPEIRPNANPQSQLMQTPPKQAGHAFLGVHVGPNFSRSGPFPPGSANARPGVVVDVVAPGSPAERAGIKVGDTLTAFADQKLVAAGQLVQLVRADAPNHQVTIDLVRDGKPQKVQVTLGEAPIGPNDFMPPPGPMGRSFGPGMGPIMGPRNFRQELSSAWQNFDSFSLKKTGDGKFRVEVEYVEKDAKTDKAEPKKYVFEGTPAEIHRAIEEAKNLTLPERFQLHRMLQFPGLEAGPRFPNPQPGVGSVSPPNPKLDETPPK